jgi:beta-N-acetylhexosaminidase
MSKMSTAMSFCGSVPVLVVLAALAGVGVLSWARPLPALRTLDAAAPAGTGGTPGSAVTAPSAAMQLGLSPRQLAGQRVIYSYRRLTPPATLLRKVRAGEAAGVIFFGENISSRAQIRTVIGELQQAAAQGPVKAPLLMMTDQEGGHVRRLPGAPVLSEKQIGASADPASAAQQAGRGAGLNLKDVGMNVNLAPVLDVYRNPGNFIDQFGRSYSMSPRKVARLGGDFIRAQQRIGVAATAKHFPGLGAAARMKDTDRRTVTLRLSLRVLRAVDELPYPSAISSGVRVVMVSWATYPALDSRRPAGLSTAVVRGELRRRLKFAGVTITDALDAGALRAFGPVSNRAVLAARAGMDLLLCSARSVREGTSAVTALAAALQRDQVNRPAFVASVERVIALRSGLTA